MGADVSVFEEGELEESFWKYHGPNNESLTDLAQRTIRGNINQRKCTDYTASDAMPSEYYRKFECQELRLVSSGIPLNCLYFTKLLPEGFPASMLNSDICIVYVHTNTRASIDAVELLPLCQELQCDLAAFDLPGCGKSGGTMAVSMAHALFDYIQYMKFAKKKDKIVVWARGMGTGVAVEFASNPLYRGQIAFMVLDSPFVSTERMIAEIVERVRGSGYYIPSSVVDLSKYVTKKAFSHYYKGVDPMKVNPLKQILEYKKPMVSCHVFAATEDDYVSSQQGYEIAMAWTGPCNYQTYSGRHFGPRSSEMVLTLASTIFEACRDPSAGDSPDPSESIPVRSVSSTVPTGTMADRKLSKDETELFDADDLLTQLQEAVPQTDNKMEAPKTPTKPISSASESTSPSMKAFGFGGLGTLSPKFASQPSTLASTTSPNGMKKSISSGHIPALARVDPVSISDAAVIPSSGRNGGGMTRSKSMMTFGLFQKK